MGLPPGAYAAHEQHHLHQQIEQEQLALLRQLRSQYAMGPAAPLGAGGLGSLLGSPAGGYQLQLTMASPSPFQHGVTSPPLATAPLLATPAQPRLHPQAQPQAQPLGPHPQARAAPQTQLQPSSMQHGPAAELAAGGPNDLNGLTSPQQGTASTTTSDLLLLPMTLPPSPDPLELQQSASEVLPEVHSMPILAVADSPCSPGATGCPPIQAGGDALADDLHRVQSEPRLAVTGKRRRGAGAASNGPNGSASATAPTSERPRMPTS